MSNVNQQGNTGGGRPPSAVVNTNDPLAAASSIFNLGPTFQDTSIAGETVANYAGDANASVWLLGGNALPATVISGIALEGGNPNGRVLLVVNNASLGGTKNLEFTHLDSGSELGNQFYLPGAATLTLAQGEGAVFVYGTYPVNFGNPAQPVWLCVAVNQA